MKKLIGHLVIMEALGPSYTNQTLLGRKWEKILTLFFSGLIDNPGGLTMTEIVNAEKLANYHLNLDINSDNAGDLQTLTKIHSRSLDTLLVINS